MLSSEGPVPLYYWLIRETDPKDRWRVRQFLTQFQQRRQANARLAKDPELIQKADPTLLRFDSLNRSPNDPGSLAERYDILRKQFSSVDLKTSV